MRGQLKFSAKSMAFLRCRARCEFLEGTTAAGKTTVALLKFMLRCAASDKKLHILSGLDTGTVEKNIINKEFGILDDFGPLADYYPAGYGKTTQDAELLVDDVFLHRAGSAGKKPWAVSTAASTSTR